MLKKLGSLAIIAFMAGSALSAGAAENKELIAGRKIFQSNCISCHLKTGKGSPMMAQIFKVDVKNMDLDSVRVAAMKKQEIVGIITNGKAGKMPTFKGKLGKKEITEVASYIHSLGAEKLKKSAGTSNSVAKKSKTRVR